MDKVGRREEGQKQKIWETFVSKWNDKRLLENILTDTVFGRQLYE